MSGIVCEACKRRMYESTVRACPKKDGTHYVCQYCCRRCKRQYKGEWTGWGCRAFDEKKALEAAMVEEAKKGGRKKQSGADA